MFYRDTAVCVLLAFLVMLLSLGELGNVHLLVLGRFFGLSQLTDQYAQNVEEEDKVHLKVINGNILKF